MIIPKSTEIDVSKITSEKSASQTRLIHEMVRNILAFSEDIYDSIRHTDAGESEHYRFDMSGGNIAYNDMILNKFEKMGIHNNVDFLCIRFHKGSAKVFVKANGEYLEIDGFTGWGTVEIITAILQITKRV